MSVQLETNEAAKTQRQRYHDMTWIELLSELGPYAGILPFQQEPDEKEEEAYRAIGKEVAKRAGKFGERPRRYLLDQLADLMNDFQHYIDEVQRIPVMQIGSLTPYLWPGRNHEDVNAGYYLRLRLVYEGEELSVELDLDERQVSELLAKLKDGCR